MLPQASRPDNQATPADSDPTAKPAKNGGKSRLGRTLGSHVDPTAAAFPVNMLSRSESAQLQSAPQASILVERMAKPAIFWDRDNTLIEDPGYISDPQQVKLLPAAAGSLRQLAEAGFENIIVTNQSGIARGLLDETQLEQIHNRLRELLSAEGADIDAIYYCPYLAGPEATVEKYRMDSDLRKPNPGMLAKASLERKIDLAASWMVGNSLSDTQAGRAAGCRTILLVDNNTRVQRDRSVDFVAPSLDEVVNIIMKYSKVVTMTTPTAGKDNDNTPSAHDEIIASTAQEILSFMRMVDRRRQTEDFSLCRLLGIVVQMVAVAVILWATFSMVSSNSLGTQMVRFLFALVLQTLALTCFFLSRR